MDVCLTRLSKIRMYNNNCLPSSSVGPVSWGEEGVVPVTFLIKSNKSHPTLSLMIARRRETKKQRKILLGKKSECSFKKLK